MSEPIHIISLGAGVQSSTMALMAAQGEIAPMPSFAVFSDTGDEPQTVYTWLNQLKQQLPFSVKIAHKRFGSWVPLEQRRLSAHIVENDFSQIPAFTQSPNGRPLLGKRQCTRHWKIDPLHQKIREVLNVRGKRMKLGSVVLWIGISTDEAARMKPSRNPWITHRFPLIEKKLSRADCTAWLKSKGVESPVKSACVYCPFKDRAAWLAAKNGPDWETVRVVDAILASRGEFLTADLLRIDDVDFSKPVLIQRDPRQEMLWNNECEGMCGV